MEKIGVGQNNQRTAPTLEEQQACKERYEKVWDGNDTTTPAADDRDWVQVAIVEYSVPNGGWFGPSRAALLEALATAARESAKTHAALDEANAKNRNLQRSLFRAIGEKDAVVLDLNKALCEVDEAQAELAKLKRKIKGKRK